MTQPPDPLTLLQARVHVAEGEVDLLWCVEEALRSAPIALVIA